MTRMIPRHLMACAVSLSAAMLAISLAGCGAISPSGDPRANPGSPGDSPLLERDVDVTIEYEDGQVAERWSLTCNPSGGTHPDPELACRVLIEKGAEALPAVARDRVCAQVVGSAQSATVTGTWRGQSVSSSFNLTNSCEVNRWKAMVGLLPPPAL